MVSEFLREGERLDDLMRGGLHIIQRPDCFRFGTDAVLLAHFAHITGQERVCDLGTGCGILPLLMCARASRATVDAVEIQSMLSDMACRSVALNGLEGRITVHQADLCHLQGVLPSGKYDAVVCNPPYGKNGQGLPSMTEAVRIARHETLCTLADIFAASARLLKNGGRLCMIHQSGRAADVLEGMRACGIEPKIVRAVHYQADQPAKLVLFEGRKQAGSGLSWLPPLILRDAQGEETQELRKIYGMDE